MCMHVHVCARVHVCVCVCVKPVAIILNIERCTRISLNIEVRMMRQIVLSSKYLLTLLFRPLPTHLAK